MQPQVEPQVEELVWANRILANEGVLDGFGHVSVRSAERADRFWIACSRPPQFVRASDILACGLDGEPVEPTDRGLYGERVLHAAAYEARDDVGAVAHIHAYPLLPFSSTRTDIRPIFHMAGMFHDGVAFYDDYDVSHGTIISSLREARRIARALGHRRCVLMCDHGAVVVAEDLRRVVMSAIYLAVNAEQLSRALAIGRPRYLPEETARAAMEKNFGPGPMRRAWEYWCGRVPRQWLE